MESLLIRIKREKGVIIPYEYNYYLSIGIYSKLLTYQEKIKKLHVKSQPGLHTFSNIISRNVKGGINGLDINNGFFIVRTIDNSLSAYLRLGLSIDPSIRINDVSYEVTKVISLPEPMLGEGKVKFKSLSPILIRNFENKNEYVDISEDVEINLNKSAVWILKNLFEISEEEIKNFHIYLSSSKRKTVKISNSKTKESITTAYELRGEIEGSEKAMKALYYRGLGSKPSLGLGCWEVI
ncbi:CRISPR-associated endoribonuclease Cas6 [Cuniculiplasma sp. SKW3]|uniref:CRISPR-associated endoribonuclease Cas6 n=1 Tax=Cuniculiplasma sp. SKW3 TaxID=3400170 RepID=UPI003FD2DFA8